MVTRRKDEMGGKKKVVGSESRVVFGSKGEGDSSCGLKTDHARQPNLPPEIRKKKKQLAS